MTKKDFQEVLADYIDRWRNDEEGNYLAPKEGDVINVTATKDGIFVQVNEEVFHVQVRKVQKSRYQED